jgi:hypothetical protein
MRRRGFLLAVAAVAAATAPAGCGGWETPPHRPFPQVPSRDGALLSPLRLVTIISSNQSADTDRLFGFSDAAVKSAWWRTLADEYHLGAATSAATLIGPDITADVTDHDVFTYIEGMVQGSAPLQPDGNTLYLLYLPAGVTVISRGVRNDSCAQFGAYHAVYGSRGDNLAVVQRCPSSDVLDVMTAAASHEIIEAATDPDLRSYALPDIADQRPWTESIWNAWELEGGAELADLCEGTFYEERGFFYQRVWSNRAAAAGGDPCIPALDQPFYDTTFDRDWYAVSAGATVSIPVNGWSTAAVADWGVRAAVDGTDPGFAASFPSSTSVLNSGGTLPLSVTAPAGAPSGSFAVVMVASTRPARTNLSDGAHLSPVGVYVP